MSAFDPKRKSGLSIRYHRRPRTGGGCRSVNRNRRREQLAAQPAGTGHLGRRRLSPRDAGALCGRYERAPARCDVVGSAARRPERALLRTVLWPRIIRKTAVSGISVAISPRLL